MNEISASPGYVLGQLARALVTSETHDDPAARARASEKIRRFEQVIAGMLGGSLAIGSRTPTSAPAWATLEVVKGGFATGQLLANGPLQPHEEELLASLPANSGGSARARLNAYHLTDAGFSVLTTQLRSGGYRISVPEEGALLVVAWLLSKGQRARAQELLEPLVDRFDQLRFYPVPAASPSIQSAFVRLQPVSDTVASLDAVRVRPQIARMNETLRVWAPLEDRLVSLLCETVEGEQPHVLLDASGQIAKTSRGGPAVGGGFPLSRLPSDLRARARQLLDEHRALAARHPLCKRHTGAKSNLGRLLGCLDAVLRQEAPTRDQMGIARTVLATIVHKRGLPGSERHGALRAAQAEVAQAPTREDLAHVLALRLASHPKEGSIDALEPLTVPVAEVEAQTLQIRAGDAILPSLCDKLARSLAAPIEELVERGIIPSGEVLAIVAPQITSAVRAAGIADPALRRLYESIDIAFRKRRSLLLLDLQQQVRIEELPWVAVLNAERRDPKAGLSAGTLARETLLRLTQLAIVSFPEVILPNKLLTEIDTLGKAAGLTLPITEELAADIFMGTFSWKFVSAAQVAARLLSGTVYARYYGLPFDRVSALSEPAAPKRRKREGAGGSAKGVPAFAELCTQLAGASAGSWSVARNGTIIEQQQILTTHNLAVLFDTLSLGDALGPELPALAQRCFLSICKQHTQPTDDWRSKLLRLKNTAYAWRQMLFFLSMAHPGALPEFLPWANEALPGPLRAPFSPAMRGLAHVAHGGRFDEKGSAEGGAARRFLGWTIGKHWLES